MIEQSLKLADRTIPVRFANQRCEWVAQEIHGLTGTAARLFLVTDERVAFHYEAELRRELTSRHPDFVLETIPPGEHRKSWHTAANVLDRLVLDRFARDDLVIGFGGGVVCDVTGFVASIYQRGVRWLAVPTTLLAMVDAAIGGKTGVDHALGKNLIGTFHQPLAVLAPLGVLDTLDAREWSSGSAEAVKAALLSGGALWEQVRSHGPDLRTWPREHALDFIPHAARFKLDIVAQDERESGMRRVLNFGHTLGHALESVTGYSAFKHGEAVFLGMRAAIRLSERFAGLDARVAREIEGLLSHAWYPHAAIEPDSLLEAITRDKKKTGRKINWVLLRDIGEPVVTPEVSEAAIRDTCRWLGETVETGAPVATERKRLRALVLNGPNLNLLGEREPEIYGRTSYSELEETLLRFAGDRGLEVIVRQSNIEGELISLLQQARHWADGVVFNPGGYTHTSVALRDAIKAIGIPVIEVHLTDLAAREAFRHTSLIAEVCSSRVCGKGIGGYREALEQLLNAISTQPT